MLICINVLVLSPVNENSATITSYKEYQKNLKNPELQIKYYFFVVVTGDLIESSSTPGGGWESEGVDFNEDHNIMHTTQHNTLRSQFYNITRSLCLWLGHVQSMTVLDTTFSGHLQIKLIPMSISSISITFTNLMLIIYVKYKQNVLSLRLAKSEYFRTTVNLRQVCCAFIFQMCKTSESWKLFSICNYININRVI